MELVQTTPEIVRSCDELAELYQQLKNRPLAADSLERCRTDPQYHDQLRRYVTRSRSPEQIQSHGLPRLADMARQYHYHYGFGLGDAVAKLASAVGLEKKEGCGCGRRQDIMNRWASIGGKARHIKQWGVAVTTAPRKKPTLERCLASLIRAGWYELAIVAEPETETPHLPRDVALVKNERRLGCWHNYRRALAYLLDKYPAAEALMIVQDDTIFAGPGLRQWCEYHVKPDRMHSLYTPGRYKSATKGWVGMNRGQGLWGALALIWPRRMAELWLQDDKAKRYRGKPHYKKDDRGQPIPGTRYYLPPEKLANVDAQIGDWMRHKAKKSVNFIFPSLAQHVGNVSTIPNHGGASGNRAAADFVGEQCGFDCLRGIFE